MADENIHPSFIDYLISLSFDIADVRRLKLIGASDESLISFAEKEQRIIVTQDRDFGKLVYSAGKNFIGIIYLRPGHFNPGFHEFAFKSII